MGCISKEAFRRLVVLYCIGKFQKHRVLGAMRLQKVLYYGEDDSNIVPFTFKHTSEGQFSDQVRDTVGELTAMGYLKRLTLSEEGRGKGWELADASTVEDYSQALRAFSLDLQNDIDKSIVDYGYLEHPDLRRIAHDDPRLKEVPLGEVLIEENMPDIVESSLSTEDCEDIELSLNPKFIRSVRRVVGAKNCGDFDPDKVVRVVSF